MVLCKIQRFLLPNEEFSYLTSEPGTDNTPNDSVAKITIGGRAAVVLFEAVRMAVGLIGIGHVGTRACSSP